MFNVFGQKTQPHETNHNQPMDSQQLQRPQGQQQSGGITSVSDLFRGASQPQSPPSIPNPPGAFPKSHQPSASASTTSYQTSGNTAQGSGSASTTPVSSVTANSGGSNLQQTDNRQNALLSTLFGSVTGQTSNSGNSLSQSTLDRPSTPPLLVPTAPSPPTSENQGRVLLEQLMGPKQTTQPAVTGQAQYASPYATPAQSQVHHPISQQQQPPPSPPRKSMFDFVSPFDALENTNVSASAASAKRKPVPGAGQSSGEESNPNTAAALDVIREGDKRKSVENLMETLTRGQPSSQPPLTSVDSQQGRSQGLSSRTNSEASKPTASISAKHQVALSPPNYTQAQNTQSQTPLIPLQRNDSPTPTTTPAARDLMNQPQRTDLPTDREWRISDPKPKAVVKDYRTSTNRQHQSITFDVSQPLETIQAPPESSLSTPIALVKVEPTFLPGSTIGATSWIAYAMTRGRVRVISRASGDRTLLQLPSAFPPSTSVVDMAVFSNRLAGVTSDGGFVIWELPQIITDDVPGKLLLCVVPPPEPEALRSVRWHPKKPETVAVASESRIYLLNINEASRRFGSDPVAQSDLAQVGPVINLSSPLVAFAFDVPHLAIATISDDSTLELWRISNQLPFWSAKVPGESIPSSIDFLEGGIVIGRKNGTIFQLLSVMSDTVLSTLKFIDTQNKDDRDMFGHVAYDSRIQTLWIANSRRESLIGVQVSFEAAFEGEEQNRGGCFEQITEFVGPKPSIHFVILTADSDPHGEEAQAACTASKVPPGPLAMVAFSVHAQGVDQIIIRKEWFDNALLNASAKLPSSTNPFQHPVAKAGPVNFGMPHQTLPLTQNPRPRTPPLEDGEGDSNKDDTRHAEVRNRSSKGKAVGFKDKDNEVGKESKEKDKYPKAAAEPSNIGEWASGSPWSKDLRKMEESLHTRVGRTIGKELEKQQQRLEDARAADQSAEVARQEKIIKLISTELTKNTTRVVEMAVKSEVQNSVLPALEVITKNEVKAAVNGQISKGLSESMKQTLPNEIERLLLRPDVSNHVARTFSSAVTPIIERHVKDAITKTLIPAYVQESTAMHQEISRELHSEILNLKKEVITWQSEALRGQESLIRDLEQSIRGLQEQVKYMNINLNASAPAVSQHLHQHRGSPVLATSPHANISAHLRGPNLPPTNYNAPQTGYSQPPPVNPATWFATSAHAPLLSQAMPTSQPTQGPMPSGAVSGGQPEGPKEDWDETYLAVLGTQDPRQLRDLLSRSNPDVIMPLNSTGPLSQAVVLTLIHRLSAAVGETSPVEEAFKASLWWLQRSANTLNTNDPLISPYVGRVLPTVQTMLNTTKSRLSLLPGGPPLIEASRTISEVQEVMARKSGT